MLCSADRAADQVSFQPGQRRIPLTVGTIEPSEREALFTAIGVVFSDLVRGDIGILCLQRFERGVRFSASSSAQQREYYPRKT